MQSVCKRLLCHVITARSELRKFCFSAVCDFVFLFACESNISGTAEQICAKFTGKTCLVPGTEEFECQSQRSKVKVTRDKNTLCTPITPGGDGMERARCK